MIQYPNRLEQPFAWWLTTLFALALFIFIIVSTINGIREGRQIGLTDGNTITVDGSGSIEIPPDLATITATVSNRANAGSEASNQTTQIMNDLIGKIKNLGIEDKDLRTQSISVYEEQSWNSQTNRLEGTSWVAQQSLTITVRNTEAVAEIVRTASNHPQTSIYGPNFSVDATETYLPEAREEAIANAKAKAREIAKALNLKLGSVIDYSEYQGGNYPYPMAAETRMDSGSGGASTPDIQPGTQTVELNVSITYQLKPGGLFFLK